MEQEQVLDVIEEVQDLSDIQRSAVLTALACGIVGGLLIGGATGYRLAKRYLEPKYAAIAEDEIHAAKEFYSLLNKKGPVSTPEGAVKVLQPGVKEATTALREYRGESPDEPDVVVEVETTNVFVEGRVDDEWDYAYELPRRSPDEPYVIHEDEWSEAQNGYSKVTLTWYSGDTTLADEKDEPIPAVDDVVGLENLSKFGHGTGDAHTVFIRNEQLGEDIEVLWSDGKFSEEVAGIQHSDDFRARHRHPNRSRAD